MGFLRPGPRVYRIFISHRYDDDLIYTALRRHLVDAKNFRYNNLSIEVDKQLDTDTPGATKRSLSSKIRKADILLVFAHSAGEMVEFELERAKHYGVPVISILDPTRLDEKYKKARSRFIAEMAVCETRLDQPEQVVAAIRKHARAQAPLVLSGPFSSRVEEQPINSPKDIAQRMSEEQRRPSFMSRVGAFLLGRSSQGTARR